MVNFTILAGGYTTFLTAFVFNPDIPSLSVKGTYDVANRASWLARPKGKNIFYAAEENWPGSIKSLKLDENGVPVAVDRVASGGNGPAYVGLTPNGEVIALNFNSGNGRAIALDSEDGATFNSTTFHDFKFDAPTMGESNPHHFYPFQNMLVVADLGADKVWQLQRNATLNDGTYNIIGFYNETNKSGPRRAIGEGNTLWVLHELDNTLTERNLPLPNQATIPTIYSVVTTPPGTDSSSGTGAYHAAELLRPDPNDVFKTEYLYVSNRAITSPDPLGDTIAIFSTKPLKKVAEVHTGLNQIRGMEFGGENDKYLIAAGLTGGGVAVYERIQGGADLKLVARNWEESSMQRTTFIWW